MRLSRIWRILQIKEDVIHRSWRPRWITPSEICRIFHILRKRNFYNCFIIHSKYFLLLKGVSPLRSLFFRSPNITQPCPQVFSVNGSIICSELPFWRHFGIIGSIIFGGTALLTSLIQYGEDSFQQLVMVNYACGFKQLETGKYFERIIKIIGMNGFVFYLFALKATDQTALMTSHQYLQLYKM